MKAVARVERDYIKQAPRFSSGDTVRVHVQVVEGQKVRTQIFEGTVMGRKGGGLRETFTVRKVTGNVAVERIFPVHSPNIQKIEKVRDGKVRRAKLTYMRSLKGKKARIAGRALSAVEIQGQPERDVKKDKPAEAEAAGAEDAAAEETAAE